MVSEAAAVVNEVTSLAHTHAAFMGWSEDVGHGMREHVALESI